VVLAATSSFADPVPRPVTIAVATDLHELAPSLHDDGQAYRKFAATGAGRDILHTEQLLDTFERDLAIDRPRWLLVTGDLTNNGERLSHQALAARLARIEAAGTSVLVIPGNHDIANPWARSFRGDRQGPAETVNADEFASIYRAFGYDAPSVREPASLSYRAVLAPGLWVLMLDTNRYRDNLASGRPATDGRLLPETLTWVRAQAEEARRQHIRVIVAQHHSLFDHSSVISEGFTLDNASVAEEVYADVGIRLVLSGHIHIQDIVAKEVSGQTLYDIATNALPVYPNQYARLVLDPVWGKGRYQTQGLKVEAWARASGHTDPELTGYQAWSAQAFDDGSRALAHRGLGDLPPADEQKATDTLLRLNERYFAGRQSLNADLVGSEGLRILEASPGFLAGYAESILTDEGTDDNTLDFAF
jgi:3',5'-cyclic AMP phosphodiesterase CpdA